MRKGILRYSILIFFLVLYSVFSVRHFILGGGVAASVDALCPFGGFETLYTFIATGGFVPRILMSSLVLAVGVLLTAIVLRRGFCGYICPFGTVQELLGKLSRRKMAVPKAIDRNARYIKYGMLAAILIGTALTGTLVFREYDPFITFFHFGKGLLWGEEEAVSLVPIGITIAVLSASIIIL